MTRVMLRSREWCRRSEKIRARILVYMHDGQPPAARQGLIPDYHVVHPTLPPFLFFTETSCFCTEFRSSSFKGLL